MDDCQLSGLSWTLYRMALDHADRIERLCVLNVIPTAERFDRLDADSALEYWPFLLLAQPAPFAEQLITASAQDIVRHLLDTWVAAPARSSRAPPSATWRLNPATIAAWCADYRAAFHLDRPLDAEDRAAGRTITARCSCTGGAVEDVISDGPLSIWRRWASDVRGRPLPGSHFIPEEAADELLASLRTFLIP